VLQGLSEATDPPKFAVFSRSGYKGSKPVIAKLDAAKIKVWKRQRGRNSFAPFFWGSIAPDAQGARIEGYFGMDPFAKAFMVFWLGCVLFGVISGLITMPSGANHGRAWSILIFSMELIVIGYLLPKIGKWMTRGEEKYLREFLETTLAAQPLAAEFSLSGRAIENKPL
jgi:hypothetical protein